MRIEVKPEHIAAGIRCSHTHCPVALAIRGAGGTECSVTRRFIENTAGERINAPEALSDFVDDFDHHREVEPFAFDLPDGFLGVDGGEEAEEPLPGHAPELGEAGA